MERDYEETLCDLQAQAYAQGLAIRAFARTHADPERLLKAWRDVLAEPATCSPIPAHARNSSYLAEQVRVFVEDWTAELVELAVPGQ